MLPNEIAEEIKSVVHRQPQIKLVEVFASTFQEVGIVPPSGAICVLWAERWRQRLYYTCDQTAVELLIEIGMGGESPRTSPRAERKLTSTERAILEVFFKRFARALTNAFSLLVDVTFTAASVGGEVEEDSACRPTAPVMAAKIDLDWFGMRGTVMLIIPQSALEPVRTTLAVGSVVDAGEPEAASPSQDEWTRKLTDEIARAFVTLQAVLEQRPIPFRQVQRFRVGSTLPLESTSISTVRLDVEERPAFWCELGRAGGEFSLRIEREFDLDDLREMEF
jgi:flagellar motor switch protein FliM